jgi:dimethylargininase
MGRRIRARTQYLIFCRASIVDLEVAMPSSPQPALIAVTRPVSSAMACCELTHLPRTQIDIGLAREQHAAYERALSTLGCRLERLPEAPALADSVFVEDTAIVLDDVAIVTRPGALSRRAETASVAHLLGRYRRIAQIAAPATLDGGDVLRVNRTLYVGRSGRSNRCGIERLAALVTPFGYRVEAVPVHGCLHLKSAVTQVAADTVLINPQYIATASFGGLKQIEVDPAEPLGANALLLGGEVIYPASQPRTAQRLCRHGVQIRVVDVSELEKAEGAVTCCSLIFAGSGGEES